MLCRARLRHSCRMRNSVLTGLTRVARSMTAACASSPTSFNAFCVCISSSSSSYRAHSTLLAHAQHEQSRGSSNEHAHTTEPPSVCVVTSLSAAYAQLQRILDTHMQQLLSRSPSNHAPSEHMHGRRHEEVSLLDVVHMLHRFWSMASETILVPRQLRTIEDFPLFLLTMVRGMTGCGAVSQHHTQRALYPGSDDAMSDGHRRTRDRFARMSDDAILHEFEQWMEMSTPRRALAPTTEDDNEDNSDEDDLHDVISYVSLLGYIASYVRYHIGVRWGASSHPRTASPTSGPAHSSTSYALHPWHRVYCPAGHAAQMPFVHVMQWMLDSQRCTSASAHSDDESVSRRLQRHHSTELFAPPSSRVLAHADAFSSSAPLPPGRPGFAVLDLCCQSGFGVDLLLKAGATHITAVDGMSAARGNTEATVHEHRRERRSRPASGCAPASVVMCGEEYILASCSGTEGRTPVQQQREVMLAAAVGQTTTSSSSVSSHHDSSLCDAEMHRTSDANEPNKGRPRTLSVFHMAALQRRRGEQPQPPHHISLECKRVNNNNNNNNNKRCMPLLDLMTAQSEDDNFQSSHHGHDQGDVAHACGGGRTTPSHRTPALLNMPQGGDDGVYDVIYYHPPPPSLLPMQAFPPWATRRRGARGLLPHPPLSPACSAEEGESHVHGVLRLLRTEGGTGRAPAHRVRTAPRRTQPASPPRALLCNGGYVIWVLPRTHNLRALLAALHHTQPGAVPTTLSDAVVAQLEDVYEVVLRRRHRVVDASDWATAERRGKRTVEAGGGGGGGGEGWAEVELMQSMIDMLCASRPNRDTDCRNSDIQSMPMPKAKPTQQQQQLQSLKERLYSQLHALYSRHMWVDVLVLKKRPGSTDAAGVRRSTCRAADAERGSGSGSGSLSHGSEARVVRQRLHRMYDDHPGEPYVAASTTPATAETAMESDESTVNGVSWLDSFDYQEYKPQSHPGTREHWTDLVPSYSYLEEDYWSPQEAHQARSCFLAVGHPPLLQAPPPRHAVGRPDEHPRAETTTTERAAAASSLREEQQRAAAAAYRSVFTNELRTRRRSKMRKLALDGLDKQEWFIDHKLVQSEAAKVEFMNQLTRWKLKDKE